MRRRRSTETSRRVYGPTTQRRWAYADSKAMDEFLALAYHQERGLDCIIARLFNTVGPEAVRPVRDGRPALRRARARRRAARDLRRRPQTRCFCHVSDTIRALYGLMEARRRSGEIYNVGSTEQISISTSRNACIDATGSARRLSPCPFEEVYGRRDRGHAAPHPVDREDPRRDRLAADARSDRILADVIDHIRSLGSTEPARV